MKKSLLFGAILVSSLALGACSLGGQTQEQNQTGVPGNGQGMMGRSQLDLSAAAEKLGVTEEKLQEAMGDPTQGERVSMQDAADKLGVSLEELREALGMPEGMPEGGMGRGPNASGSGMPMPPSQQ